MTKNNLKSNRYQGPNRRGRETGRESAMLTALITCHYCKKSGHKARDCKNFENEYEMEKSGKLNQRGRMILLTRSDDFDHLDLAISKESKRTEYTLCAISGK